MWWAEQQKDESASKCSATSQAIRTRRLPHFEQRCRRQKQLAEKSVTNLLHDIRPKKQKNFYNSNRSKIYTSAKK